MNSDYTAHNYIDGEYLRDQALKNRSVSPADGSEIGSFVESDATDAQTAIAAARRVFDGTTWSHDAKLRQDILLEWASRLERRDDLAPLLTRENGKTSAQSKGEMGFAISEIRYYAGLARHIPGQFQEVAPGCYSATLREAAGVAAMIIPWNAPVILLVRSLAPAIAAGCTAVVKVAPETALILSETLKDLFAIESLPKGAVNLLLESGHTVSQALTRSPDVDVLSFTGSNRTGQKIMADAAPTMKKLSLELGGKASCLVFPDVDVELTADRLAKAATIISGQQCTAARRILVHRSIFQEMKAALKAAFSRLKVDRGETPGAAIGPLISKRAMETYLEQVTRALESCDEVILEGGRLGGALAEGCFVAPTLVAHQDSSAFFCQEELFGPFVVLEQFETESEAIARANHTVYGLAASVWTKDGDRGLRIARALRNGTVWINDHNRMFAEAETGGYRQSGIGRLHGYEGLGDFLETKHIFRESGFALSL